MAKPVGARGTNILVHNRQDFSPSVGAEPLEPPPDDSLLHDHWLCPSQKFRSGQGFLVYIRSHPSQPLQT